MNDSSTGGPLYPLPTPAPTPLGDQDLSRFMQQLVAGITGLPGTMVRPRWQPESPDIPPFGSDWVAQAVVNQETDVNAVVIHRCQNATAGNGYDELQRHETFDLFCSFYGPHCDEYASLLRDGLGIAQNREVLFLNGMGFIRFSDKGRVPVMLKKMWWQRVDMTVTFRRAIQRFYGVLNLVSAEGTITSARGTVQADNLIVPFQAP